MGFPNLAGAKTADATIRRELADVGLTIVEEQSGNSEVPYESVGALSFRGEELKFYRRWVYYSVEGMIPLDLAIRLYDESVCAKRTVRVDGDCTCPDPRGHAKWFTGDGKQVLPTSQRAEFEQLAKSGSSLGIQWLEEAKKKYIFSDFPLSHGASQYISGYHIDSELGLYLLVDALKRYGEE